MRMINKFLGGMLSALVMFPFMLVLAASRVFNFVDYLFRGQFAKAFISLVFNILSVPLFALLGVLMPFENGWKKGLGHLLKTLPTRLAHFFKTELSFGSKEEESVRELCIDLHAETLVTPGFFGTLSLKLLSLFEPMEMYLAYGSRVVSPHNDVSKYFTESNLTLLKDKYEVQAKDHVPQLMTDIKAYLEQNLNITKAKLEALKQEPATSESSGKLQSARDQIAVTEAAQRCVDYFSTEKSQAHDLSEQHQQSTDKVLSYVWLAIQEEGANESAKESLREKLTLTLFQIQRGFNIAMNDTEGTDMPECVGGAIGLLVRVVCNEPERMPASPYAAGDPSPANLSLALKSVLDRPFQSSFTMVVSALRRQYSVDSVKYKEEQKKEISEEWKQTYAPLFKAKVMREDEMDALIEAGVEAWEPPVC